MGELSFKDWLLQTELVFPGEPAERPLDMAAMMRRGGGGPGAFATGTAPSKPWDGPGGVATPAPKIPSLQNDGWSGSKRQIARRIKPITPKGSMIAKPPKIG